ncbi:S8/S53 family peptidase [Streptosporangium sp. KLBMP 9127]|nr:S8/S53 family peptidase [Streptosporangium sp. KLBMP 9127]
MRVDREITVAGGDDAPALIRPGQLLTDGAGAAAAERWSEAVSEFGGICRLRLSPGVDPCEIASDLRDLGHTASPNHVLAGQPLFFGGPASRPFPTGPITLAPAGAGRLGRGATVALLDTGLDAHPWWAESAWFTDQRGDIGERTDADRDDRLDAQAGHGTFIAGLLVRRAHGVRLRVMRVLDSHGVGDEAGLLRALARLHDRPPHLINLSLGGHTVQDLPPLLVAGALARMPGTVVVAAAGNSASPRPLWPAALPQVIAVGALDPTETFRAPFSAYGPWVDACARGEWLASTFLTTGPFDGYARWSGTSFAAALVTGAIADAARDMPPSQAAAHVLDPLRSREIPDLGVVVPADR